MFIAALLLFSIMIISTVDVGMRYAVSMPLAWSYDLISLFLMSGVFFFSLSDTLRSNEHVGVDLLHGSMSERARHGSLVPGYILASIVFCAMTWIAYGRVLTSYANDEVIAGSILWPNWIAGLSVALGLGITSLRLIYRSIGHVLSAFVGRSYIALPPLSSLYEAV